MLCNEYFYILHASVQVEAEREVLKRPEPGVAAADWRDTSAAEKRSSMQMWIVFSLPFARCLYDHILV